jgi:hypothetical protein
LPPTDPTEAAFREALLGDDAGRERRHARLMAALPRPPAPVQAAPVARGLLAGRWQPYALVLLAMGGLIAAALLARTSPGVGRSPVVEPRVAAAPAAAPEASAPVVVAQALPAAELAVPATEPAAPAVRPPPATRNVPAKARREWPVVMADAGMPPPARDVAPAVAAEAAPAAPPPALSQMHAAPSAAPPAAAPPKEPPAPAVPAAEVVTVAVAAAPVPQPAAPVVADAAPVKSRPTVVAGLGAVPGQADRLERVEVTGSAVRSTLAASAASAAVLGRAIHEPAYANALLSRALAQMDEQAVREALQAGASTRLRDAQGRTPLMQAARAGAASIVELLLAAGAPKVDRDASGWTAADHAQDQGHTELAARLR